MVAVHMLELEVDHKPVLLLSKCDRTRHSLVEVVVHIMLSHPVQKAGRKLWADLIQTQNKCENIKIEKEKKGKFTGCP